jgi:hypothetical protein
MGEPLLTAVQVAELLSVPKTRVVPAGGHQCVDRPADDITSAGDAVLTLRLRKRRYDQQADVSRRKLARRGSARPRCCPRRRR